MAPIPNSTTMRQDNREDISKKEHNVEEKHKVLLVVKTQKFTLLSKKRERRKHVHNTEISAATHNIKRDVMRKYVKD